MGYTPLGDVVLSLGRQECADWIAFIDQSLATRQVEFDEHSPIDRAELERLRQSLLRHVDEGQQLILPRLSFWQITRLASGWKHLSNGVNTEVSTDTVNSILSQTDDIPVYIGPIAD